MGDVVHVKGNAGTETVVPSRPQQAAVHERNLVGVLQRHDHACEGWITGLDTGLEIADDVTPENGVVRDAVPLVDPGQRVPPEEEGVAVDDVDLEAERDRNAVKQGVTYGPVRRNLQAPVEVVDAVSADHHESLNTQPCMSRPRQARGGEESKNGKAGAVWMQGCGRQEL